VIRRSIMAKGGTFRCVVITPERPVLDCPATFVAFPAHDGELGVLQHRAPLVCKLGIGTLRVEALTEQHLFFIDGGFAQVVGDRLTILTQQAKKASELSAAAANKAMVEARAMKVRTDESFDGRQRALKRAQVQLRMARTP